MAGVIQAIFAYIPSVLAALIILIIGAYVASILGAFVVVFLVGNQQTTIENPAEAMRLKALLDGSEESPGEQPLNRGSEDPRRAD